MSVRKQNEATTATQFWVKRKGTISGRSKSRPRPRCWIWCWPRMTKEPYDSSLALIITFRDMHIFKCCRHGIQQTLSNFHVFVFSGFSEGVMLWYPNGLINLKPLSKQLKRFLHLSRNSYRKHTILHCFAWDAITPPSGEPVTARLPTYQGETIAVCLTASALCRPGETLKSNAAIYINQSSLRGATQLYPCSHSMRPCLMTFWYQRPCHLCHSPVYCRSWPAPLGRSCWELCGLLSHTLADADEEAASTLAYVRATGLAVPFLWWPLPVGTSLFSLPFGLILLLGSLRLFALLLSVLLVRIFILGLDPFQMSLSVMNCLIDTRAWKQQMVVRIPLQIFDALLRNRPQFCTCKSMVDQCTWTGQVG